MDFSLLLSSYATVWSNPEVLLMTFIGALGGVLLGAIPGMTATMGVALLIPFSFGMDLIPSIGLLLGIYCGGMYGGSISAILIHAPGTPAAAATLLDGYPMCKKGQAGKALSVAMFASFCGGVIGALVMTFLSPLVADMAMNFGPGEMFMLAVFGLSVIVAISGKSVAKGLISAFFGMLLCTVGLDPTNGIPRFITTKQTGLLDGFQFIPTLIGLFAVSEVIAGVERIIRGEEHEQKSNEKITNVLPDWKTIKKIWPNILSGGLIGTFIGAIPGAGGDIAVFVSYGASKSASKHPELYGTGIPNGVAATESANNGCSGGAMIPLLSLGVPGDSVTAILLGAFIMKGITPGPMMYVTELPTVYRVFAALMLANLCMLVVGCLGVRFFAKIVSVEKKMLYPIILVISLLGAFSINKNAFDVGVCVAFGIIGWLMNKYEFPLSPILLALILGPMCEKNFVRYMNIQRGNFFAIFLVKQLYGGLGKNFLNPALAGRAALVACYTSQMTSWIDPASGKAPLFGGADVVTAATPLAMMKGGEFAEVTAQYSLSDMFIGNIGGSLGEISAMMLLLGGLYLIFRKVISWQIPVAYIGTVAVLTFLFPQGNDAMSWMLYNVLGGGLFLGAFFMATDYVTSPVTKKGQLIFGIGCGLITVFIRYFGSYPEGVCYSILVMNCCTWIIDKYTKPTRFGVDKKAAKEAAKK